MGRWDTLPLLGLHIPDMARVHRKRKCARTLDCEKDKMSVRPRDCSASGSVGLGPIWVRCFTRCYKIANMGTKIRICPEYCLSVVLFPYPRSSATPAVSVPSFLLSATAITTATDQPAPALHTQCRQCAQPRGRGMARTVRLSNVFSSLVPLTDVLSIFYFALLCFLTMIDATRHVFAGLALASITLFCVLCVWGNNARG